MPTGVVDEVVLIYIGASGCDALCLWCLKERIQNMKKLFACYLKKKEKRTLSASSDGCVVRGKFIG